MWRVKSSKGFEPITAIVIGAIVTLSLVALALPSIYTTRTIMKIVEYEYNYDNSQLTLVALLSDREVYQKLSYCISDLPDLDDVFDEGEAKALLKSKLSSLVESKCYSLSHNGVVIVDSLNAPLGQTCTPSYEATAFVALPYGKDFGKVELKIG